MRLSRNRNRPLAAAAATGGAALMLLAAGCGGPPDGVDGDITGAWGTFPDPSTFVPEAAACHQDQYQAVASVADYAPVDCAEPHLGQTVHVGTFTDDAADLEAPPEEGSSEQRSAYRECAEQAEEFLGADFRHGRLWLGVAVPTEAGWQGGARWFRCDLMEIQSVYGAPVERQGSLAGALEDDSDLTLGCFTASVNGDDEVEDMTPAACDETHDAEFVGVWDAPNGSYPAAGDSDAETAVYEGCREQVADYVDVPVDGDLVFRTGTIADWMSEEDWAAGDRAFRCYLWLPERELSESLEGDGTDALPVQTE